jgi:hypothetical protein
MKTTIISLILSACSASAFMPAGKSSSTSMKLGAETKADLEVLAKELNPIIGFYDPMNLAENDFYNMGEEATVGFLRHAEVKHSRVAMAAFVGYCVQSNFIFPWPQHLDGSTGPGLEFSPEQQWDMIPEAAKWQIFGVIALLEVWDETGGGTLDHYMKGRKPGQYPSAQLFRDNVHFVLDLYDPLGFSKNKSEEKKARGLKAEINNGRLAMLGIFGFLSADKIPGSVPLLDSIGATTPYDGNCMIPFEGNFHL